MGKNERPGGVAVLSDRIERDVYIEAPPERVWKVITEADHIGIWFGNGEPAEIDLRPGGRIVFDHGEYGKLPAVIEKVQEPAQLSFRWAAIEADGREPSAFNSTLVEFSLTREGAGTRLRMIESGFAKVQADSEIVDERYKANAGGWGAAIKGLAAYAAHISADEGVYDAASIDTDGGGGDGQELPDEGGASEHRAAAEVVGDRLGAGSNDSVHGAVPVDLGEGLAEDFREAAHDEVPGGVIAGLVEGLR
jgi:uncharacterized protein YndB with AHSA1/START domain